MGYLGKLPTSGAFQKLDAISTVNNQAAYTMQLDGANFSPESANHMLVTVNGILQSPTTNYTINGSTITFTSALVTGDIINSIIILGDVLSVGTVSDATVTNAKTNFVSTSSAPGLSIKGDGTTDGTLQLNCSQNSHGVKIKSPAHSASQSYTLTLPATAPSADKALITDGSGNLSFGSAGLDTAGLNTAFNVSGSAGKYAVRAWAYWTMSGSHTVNGSGNVASATDNGSGISTITFSTNMEDANYAVVLGTADVSSGAEFNSLVTRSSSTFKVYHWNYSGNRFDGTDNSAIIVR